jgi:hypothetical protein
MRNAAILFTILALAGEARADGQGCPPGQAISGDTAGHCCWPGQAWAQSRAACIGAPSCPTGFSAAGESCVAASAESQPRYGLVIGGAVLLAAGYVLAMVAGVVGIAWSSADMAASGYSCIHDPGLAFIPVIGMGLAVSQFTRHQIVNPMTVNNVARDCQNAYPILAALAAIDEIMQLGGTAMIGLGIGLRERAPAADRHAAARPRWAIAPWAAPGQLGLALAGGF